MQCKQCSIDFKARNSKQKYCSLDCRNKSQEKLIEIICHQCNKVFYRHPWEINKGINKFCSTDCYYKSEVGHPSYSHVVPEEKTCPVCQKIFLAGGRGRALRKAIFCSNKCSRKARYRRGLQPNEISQLDLAYLAGFLDGEGSIMLYKRRDKVSLRLSITNTNKPVLDWMKNITNIGNINNKPVYKEHHKPAWFWLCNSEAAESILKQLLPYLKVKQEQAALGIETQERLRDPVLNTDRVWQEEYRQKMKLLNRSRYL